MSKTTSFLRSLASAAIFYYAALWLVVLVVIGTIAQKYSGLQYCLEKYFSSWFIQPMDMPVWLPGGRLTMGIIMVSLTAKLIVATKWKAKMAGINITHLGVLLLMIGGVITAYTTTEGNIAIQEGSEASHFNDFHEVELAVTDHSPADYDAVTSFTQGFFNSKDPFTDSAVPMSFEVVRFFKNCKLEMRQADEISPTLKGPASRLTLKELPADAQDQNTPGIEVKVSGLSEASNGTYILIANPRWTPAILTATDGKTYKLTLRHRQYQLPFTIHLIDFEKLNHAGTSMARAFSSKVKIIEGDSSEDIKIYMNHPLRRDGYTIYQASFDQRGIETSVFQVVHNKGQIIPYIAVVIITMGLLIHLGIQLPRLLAAATKKNLTTLLVLATLIPLTGTTDARTLSSDAGKILAPLPLQSAGRIKPFDSLARFTLLSCYHRSTINKLSASQWFAQLLLDPESAYDVKCFRIRNEDLIADLGLKHNPNGKNFYSLNDLRVTIDAQRPRIEAILKRDENQRILVEKQLVKLHGAVFNYFSLSRSLTCLTPEITITHPQLAGDLGLPPNKPVSFFQIYQHRDTLTKLAEKLTKQSDRSDPYSLALIDLISQLRDMQMNDARVANLTIIPPETDPAHNLWLTPWQVLDFEHTITEREHKLLTELEAAITALLADDSATAQNHISTFLSHSHPEAVTLAKRETLYNKLDAFTNSVAFYLLGFLLLALSWLFAGKQLRWASWSAVLIGLLIHGTGISLRMLIRGRPAPVTNIYESIIFVGFVCVLLGLIIEWKRRDGLGLIIATVPGSILHFVGFKYAMDGDTIGRLVAVLNSNFWLSTHVVSISIGYGASAIAALTANSYLFVRLFRPDKKQLLNSIAKNFTGITLVALLFCILGTILGGIWGDQSWGRFWGWDPKENGALLICLWLLIVLHGKWGKQFKELGFATMLALTNITVLLAWFGVNLLQVGLHSYGFTEGAARNLTIACACIIALTLVPTALIYIRGDQQGH